MALLTQAIDDTVHVVDDNAWAFMRVQDDTVHLTELRATKLAKAFDDSVYMTETFAYGAALSDSVYLTETPPTWAFKKVISDTVWAVEDLMAQDETQVEDDTVHLVDQLSIILRPLSITPHSSDIAGGTRFHVQGLGFSTAALSDTFDGVIDAAFWTVLDDDGVTIESPGQLQLRPGPAGLAGLVTQTTYADLDIETDWVLDQVTVGAGDTVIPAQLSLRVGTTELQLRVEDVNDGTTTRRRLWAHRGVQSAFQDITGATTFSLRVVRVGGTVWMLLNNSLWLTFVWSAGAAQIAVLASTKGAASSTVLTRLTRFHRNAMVIFGEMPTFDYGVQNSGRITGTVPAVTRAGRVDVTINSGAVQTLASGWKHTLTNRISRSSGTRTLTLLTDDILKKAGRR